MNDAQDAIRRTQAEVINADRGYNILRYILQSDSNKGQEINSLLFTTLSTQDLAQVLYKSLELIYVQNQPTEAINCLKIVLGKIWDLDITYTRKVNQALNLALENFNSNNTNYLLSQDDIWQYTSAA